MEVKTRRQCEIRVTFRRRISRSGGVSGLLLWRWPSAGVILWIKLLQLIAAGDRQCYFNT
jgi:hypothetical protein